MTSDDSPALLELLVVWQMRAEDPLPEIPGGYPLRRDPHNDLAPHSG